MSRRPGIPPTPAAQRAQDPADSFVGAALGKSARLPWEHPMVRSDLSLAVNTRLPERLKLQVDWLAAQKQIPLRQVVEEAVRAYIAREFASLGIDPGAPGARHTRG